MAAKRKKIPVAPSSSAVAGTATAAPVAFFMTNGYDGANTTESRSYVYFPELDTSKELTAYTRTELLRRSRAFEKNIGLVRRLLAGLAKNVGFLTPKAATRDLEWNAAAERAFARRALSARIFDVRGKVDFEEAQIFLRKNIWRDGDMLTVKAISATSGARFAMYESQQIRQPVNPSAKWKDGVFIDTLGRHSAYWLANPGDETGTAIKADDAIYSAHWENLGQIRGSTALVAALNNIHDIADIRRLYKHNIKVASLLGLVRTKKDENDRPGGLVGAKRGQSVAIGSGQTATFNWESVMSGGQIPDLPAGQDLKTIADDRPSPNQMALIEHLIRDISWSMDVSEKVLWDIAGLTGPAVRFTLAEFNRWIAHQQKPLRSWCRQVWVHTISQELKAGRLPTCRDPEWWNVDWSGQADMTIDKGRDGTLALQLLDRGLTTATDWYQSTEGGTVNFKAKTDQRVDEVAYQIEACQRRGIPYDVVFPPRAGAAVATSAPGSQPATNPDDDPDPAPGNPEE